MPVYHVHLSSPVQSTFRTEQVAGLFDLPLDVLVEERLGHRLTAELPAIDDDWMIGAIVGPSGSGKTTLARAAYGDAVYQPSAWPEEVAIIDCLEGSEIRGGKSEVRGQKSDAACSLTSDFRALTSSAPHLPLKRLLRVLTAVGLSSPPSWLKPYRVLSTGERFRADLARAILESSERGTRSAERGEFAAPRSALRVPSSPLLVFDEFTSTLDRTVACTASYALGKFLRRQAKGSEVRVQGSEDEFDSSPEPRTLNPLTPQSEILNPKFICLSCHTDFLPWLAPDWILDLSDSRPLTPSGASGRENDPLRLASAELDRDFAAQVPHGMRDLLYRPTWSRGSLQRPQLRLRVERVPQKLWSQFGPHHYLSGGLSRAATCYAAFWEGAADVQGSKFKVQGCEGSSTLNLEPGTLNSYSPIAFCAVVATLGWKRTKRITRLVVLPEYQGLGIGPRLAETVAAAQAAEGNRVTITASHPAILAWCSRSPRWRYLGVKKSGSTRQEFAGRTIRSSAGRAVASFEYVGGDA